MIRKLAIISPLLFLCFSAFGQSSISKPILEKFTGTWCGNCSDGSVVLKQALENNPSAISMAVHNGDPMTNQVGTELKSFYGPGSPQATINRQGQPISRSGWDAALQTSASSSASVEISFDSIGWDASAMLVTATVGIRFTGNEIGDLRVNLVIVEDSVTGTASGYNQRNYSNSNPSHPLYQAGDPIVGFVHRHVMRATTDGAWGLQNVIPSSVGPNDAFSHTFTYQMDPAFDIDQILLVAYVSQFAGNGKSDRPILNAEEVHFMDNITPINNTAIEEPTFASEVKVYPNPATDNVMFTFNLDHNGILKAEILDPMGKKVADIAQGSLNRGLHSLYWDSSNVANGMYLFRITSENESITKRVMVSK